MSFGWHDVRVEDSYLYFVSNNGDEELALSLNQIIIIFDKKSLPSGKKRKYIIGSSIFTVLWSVYNWWIDNPVTKNAQYNDEFLKEQRLK